MKINAALLALALVASTAAQAYLDPRQRVDMPVPTRTLMLANMRDHLAAIEEITRLLSERRYDEAADTAEKRLGKGSMEAQNAARVKAYMPMPMRAIDAAKYEAASRFAQAARDAKVNNDLGAAFAGLSKVMQQCLACHQAYRVH